MSHSTERATSPRPWHVIAASAATALWAGLVAWSPPDFFRIAAPFSVAWIALSATAAPPGLSARLRPRAADVALGLGTGALLYGLTRAFLWVTCGGLSEALCRPLVEMYVRFEPRALFPALALLLLVAPAEELFWRGVVQARLSARLGAGRAVALATALAVTVALASGEPFLALATLPTYALWGALAAWRGSLVPAIVSHATWSVLVASLAPPV
ncbi:MULTISPECIES: type II CAAX prenyl endopeptidase Rce1 family protein [unclassified Anaeromyxobacter]|uniref:CPBP family glutamic-type intramembrane protease n=1 Tax=unclassified Anaeromyxobacter TaxID=2620896 RepID=UPI001F57CEC5|nr:MULTISPECIES: CPBP family glutamic-type intramembrane protease [unclassified Anaeromyxobacter]